MGCTDADVQRLILDVWGPSVDLELSPAEQLTAPPRHAARAQLTGGFEGTVEVFATAAFARVVGGALHGLPPVTVDEDAAAAAVGTLAQIVADGCAPLLGEAVRVGQVRVEPAEQPQDRPTLAETVCSAGDAASAYVRVVGATNARA